MNNIIITIIVLIIITSFINLIIIKDNFLPFRADSNIEEQIKLYNTTNRLQKNILIDTEKKNNYLTKHDDINNFLKNIKQNNDLINLCNTHQVNCTI
jgi:hypothetical protein